MKAIVCKTLGAPELLVLDELPDPQPGPNDITIRVEASGVNFPDTLIIAGRYQFRPDPPFSPGCEVAGTITSVGSKVTQFRTGQRVTASLIYGGYAESVSVPASSAIEIPPTVTGVEAAVLPVVYGTTIHALEQRAQMKPGETLLVTGAAGGVGLAAVQLGKLMGARVIAAASSDEKLAVCREHGADETINYSSASLKETVKRLTGGQGADVIYDPVGTPLAMDCLSSLAWKGRYLVIGFAGGPIPELPSNRLLLKGAAALGVFWGSFATREPEVNAANMRRLIDWITSGQLKLPISRVYPLADAAKALRSLMERRATGKLVLVPG